MPSPPVSACAISLTWCRRGSGGKNFRKWEPSCPTMSRTAGEWRRLRAKGEVVHGEWARELLEDKALAEVWAPTSSVLTKLFWQVYQNPWSSYGTPGLWLTCTAVQCSALPVWVHWSGCLHLRYHHQVLSPPSSLHSTTGSNFLKLCQHLIAYLALYIDQLASPWLWEVWQACEVYNTCIVCSHIEWHDFHRYHRAQRRKRGLREGGVLEDSMEKAERLRAKVKCVGVTSEHHLHVLSAICEWVWEKGPLCAKWAPQPFY